MFCSLQTSRRTIAVRPHKSDRCAWLLSENDCYDIHYMTTVSYFRNVRCSLRQGWLNSSTFILLVDRVNPVWRISGSAVCHIRPGHSQSELITGLQMTRVVGSMISTERSFLLNLHAESAVSQIPHRPSSCPDSVSNHRGTVGPRRTGENCEKCSVTKLHEPTN